MQGHLQNQSAFATGAAAPVVAHASPSERAAFITKTYGHLLMAIVAFVALETLWFATPVAQGMLNLLSAGRFAWIAILGAFIGVSYLANRWAMSGAGKGMQYAGLALYTVAESILFLPLIAVAVVIGAQTETNLLSKAAVITLMLFTSLTGIVFVTRKDFSFMRGVLMFAGLSAFGLIVLSAVFGFTLGMFFSYAMIALAGGYILYDTSNVMLHYRTNQHVAAALALFASVMLLFWYVLRVFVDRRR
jgi:FtsH-binding integral membrane protein